MFRQVAAFTLSLALAGTTTHAAAVSPNQNAGDELLRLHLNIPTTTPLTDENIRQAVLAITKGSMTLHDFSVVTGLDHFGWNLPDSGRPFYYPSVQVEPPGLDCGPHAHAYNLYLFVEPRHDGKDIFAPGGNPITDVKVERWNLECAWVTR